MGEIEKEYIWGLTHEIAQKLDSGEWARENPADPLHGDDWGETVNQLLKSGEWKNLQRPVLASPDRIVEQDAIIKAKNAFLKKRVYEPFFETDRKGYTLKEDGKALYEFFHDEQQKKRERNDSVTRLIQIQRRTILDLSVLDLHQFAEDEFEKFQREKGRALMGSDTFLEASIQADFWSRAEQTAREAVEYGYLEGRL